MNPNPSPTAERATSLAGETSPDGYQQASFVVADRFGLGAADAARHSFRRSHGSLGLPGLTAGDLAKRVRERGIERNGSDPLRRTDSGVTLEHMFVRVNVEWLAGW